MCVCSHVPTTQLLSRVAGVHTVFVTGLVFLPLSTAEKQVSKQDKLALISVSADRTCSATFIRKKSGIENNKCIIYECHVFIANPCCCFFFSGIFKFIAFFILLLILVVVAMATKQQGLW